MLILILCLLPVWRDSAHPEEGRWFWEFIGDMQPEHQRHIPYEQAVEQAREAFNTCYHINRKSV